MNAKYTKEILDTLVKESISVAEVLRKLGLRAAGGTHSHVSRRIKHFKLDTSHFLGKGANCGENHKGPAKLLWQEVLTLRKAGKRQVAHVLRRALIESGREYKCEGEGCSIQGEWLGKLIILHVNHRNGNWLDDRAENLQFLCPNCHSQTSNYCGSKGQRYVTGASYYLNKKAQKKGLVVESVDMQVLEACAERRAGSNPAQAIESSQKKV